MPHSSHTLQRIQQFARALFATSALAMSCAALAQEQVAAVLKTHEIRFVYHSVANVLACDELRRNISAILRALGARDDVQVRVHDCEIVVIPDETSPPWARTDRDYPADVFRDRDFDQRQTSTVRVQVMFPIEATPQVLAEIDKDKSRRDLIARVTGDPAAALNDPIVFPAERKQVTLSQSTIRLRAEHCELLEQMIPTVFRELGIKVVRRQLSCDRYGRSRFAPKLTAEVLWPVGMPVPGEKDAKK
jgi:membrane glycosyltransferase